MSPPGSNTAAHSGTGHRARLRARLLSGGDEALADYELLEFLLFAGVRQGDTKPAAKALIARFGSLTGVLNADPDALKQVPGVGDAGAAAIRSVSLAARRMRLESVPNAVEQAKTVAASICGKNRPYTQVPWFWSDQYALKLQSAGVVSGFDLSVVRGDPETHSFAVFYYCAGRLIAVDAINRPAEFVAVRKLIEQGLSPGPEIVADDSISPADFEAAMPRGRAVASRG